MKDLQVIEESRDLKENDFIKDLMNKPEFHELDWIAMIKVWPSPTNGRIPGDEAIINEEFHFTIKQMNRVKKAFDNLLREIIRVKAENEEVGTNELANMATFGLHRETEEFDPELARKVRKILKTRREGIEKETVKPKRISLIKRLLG